MKKVVTGALALVMLFTLAACASNTQKVRVKCPACGYEFEAPVE